ncbi:MAG TPA: dihydrofolate reductase [Luteibaculaceae bacterium]|nr:dihydrofolate reductase [Luteibaculaceae bacterium]
MAINLIVAASRNGVIGVNNEMPWHLPDDYKYFRKVTMGHPIIMGRKTFQSIGKPLQGRTNIIVSSNFEAEGIEVVKSLEKAISRAFEIDEHPFIIGGATVYNEAYHLVDKIYHTQVDADLEGDAFFQYPDPSEWNCSFEEFHPKDDKHPYSFTFRIFDRV